MTQRNDLIPSGFEACTPSDSAFVNYVGLIVGGAGAVSVVDGLGVTTAITVIAGQTLSCRIVQVRATGTTATGLVGLKA